MKNFRSEKPFVVTTLKGTVKSSHYLSENAIATAKDSRAIRVIYGRHRGDWKELYAFKDGKKYVKQLTA